MGDVYEISDEEDNDVETEVARYMAEPQSRDDPLKWWKVNGHCFPHLHKLAKRFLCRPSTSVPSERLFSAASLTVTKTRARLDPDTVDELLFLHCYYKEKGSGWKEFADTNGFSSNIKWCRRAISAHFKDGNVN